MLGQLTAISGALLLPTAAFAQSAPTGSFIGELAIGPTKLRLRLVFSAADKATLYSIDQGNAAIPASEVVLQGDRVTLKFAAIGAGYEGRIVSPDRIEGTFTQGGQNFPLVFTRGEAPPPAPTDTGPLTQQMLDSYRAQTGTPGMAAAWLAAGTAPVQLISGARSAGLPNAVLVNDKWHLGSITKSMTATMIARLVERRKLRWTSTVGQVLGKRIPGINPAYRDVTLLHLLSHHSGLPGNIDLAEFGNFTRPPMDDARDERLRFATLALAMPPVAKPGEKMVYSNNGFIVAGLMAEQATGKSWEALMREQLFAPLGITSAGFGPPGSAGLNDQPEGHTAAPDGQRTAIRLDNPAALGPAGLVHMSLADLLRYLEAHRTRPAAFLRTASWNKLHTPPYTNKYALGWFASDEGGLWHNGSNGAWYAEIAVDRAKGVVAAFAANDAASTSGGPGPILRAAMRTAMGRA